MNIETVGTETERVIDALRNSPEITSAFPMLSSQERTLPRSDEVTEEKIFSVLRASSSPWQEVIQGQFLPASYFREAITGRLSVQNESVQNGLPEDDGFQAILQQMIAPLEPINPEWASSPSLHSDLPSTVYTNTKATDFTDSGEPKDIRAIEWVMSTDAEVPAVQPQPGLDLSLQHLPSDQDFARNPEHKRVTVTAPPEPFLLMQATSDQLARRPDSPEMLPVKPDHPGEEVPGQAVLPDVQQTMEIESLRQSAQLSMQPIQKRILSNQEALAPEPTLEPPADQESQTTTQPATADVSDTPLKRLEPASVRQPLLGNQSLGNQSLGNQSSAIQPNGLTVTAPVQNCLMLGGNRYARAVAEFPGLGAVQVVMTRHNSEVTVNLQASQQSLPALESCSSTLHQLVSDSIQQMHIPGNSVNNAVNKEEPGGSSATESGLKIAFSLTTPDHSGSGRGRQHPLAEELAARSYFSGTEGDLLALAPQTSQAYRSPIALSRHSGVALIDLHI